jgi:hypothetical protein
MMDRHDAAVGLFHDYAMASNAIEGLKSAGFAVEDVSVLTPDAGKPDTGEVTGKAPDTDTNFASAGPAVAGGVLGAAAGWLVGIGSFVIPGIGPFIGAGALMASLAGAVAGASLGALASGLVKMGVPEEHARWYEQEVQGGRTLVAVRAGGRYAEAQALLREYGAYDVEHRDAASAGAPYRGTPHLGT